MIWNRVKNAVRIERHAFDVERPASYVTDTTEKIEELIQHMEKDPQYFKDEYLKENFGYTFKDKLKFTVKRLKEPQIINDGKKDISVVAVARYHYTYEPISLPSISPYLLGGIFAAGLMAFGVWFYSLVITRAEGDMHSQPTCSLIVEDGKPIGVDVMGDRLFYDDQGKVDPMWEGTALPDQLEMAYHPIEYGCAVIHLTE